MHPDFGLIRVRERMNAGLPLPPEAGIGGQVPAGAPPGVQALGSPLDLLLPDLRRSVVWVAAAQRQGSPPQPRPKREHGKRGSRSVGHGNVSYRNPLNVAVVARA
jgi:hypothetical protein